MGSWIDTNPRQKKSCLYGERCHPSRLTRPALRCILCSMQSQTAQTGNGNTAPSQPPSLEQQQARMERGMNRAVERVNAAIQQANRRGVELDEIIPVH